jgi:hypothetical protein
MKCRKELGRRQNRGKPLTSGKAWEVPAYCPGGVRHTGGASLVQALVRNVGTCRPMLEAAELLGGDRKGEPQRAATQRGRVPRRHDRGRSRRSSEEALVMGVEPRARATQDWSAVNRDTGRSRRAIRLR